MAWAERLLERERDQLALWVPVALGTGIAAWFGLPEPRWWILFLTLSLASGGLALAIGVRGRFVRAAAIFLIGAGLGCGLAWERARDVAAPKLVRPMIGQMSGQILEVDPLPAREKIRLVVALDPAPGLPPKARINIDEDKAPAGLMSGARISARVRLVPPPGPPLPGA
jgi:competence protein ComEC